MPLEIRELHIKVTIDSGEGGGSPKDSGKGAEGQTASSGGGKVDQESIIMACVERVCEILDEKMEA